MPTATTATSELDVLLGALDVADAAVRALYLKLADDPDLAVKLEAELRELQRKRSELAHQVGVAALAEWRASRATRTGEAVADPVQVTPSAEPVATTDPPTEPVSETVLATRAEESAPVEAPAEPAAPPPSAPAAPLPAPLSAREIEQYMTAFAASPSAAAPRKRDASLLPALASHVNIGEEMSTSGAWEHEVGQLERAASEDRQKRWREMSREAQVRWLSLLVAWAKALQDDAIRLGEPIARVAEAFRNLRGFSISDNPGFVHGFARTAMPRWSGTWRMDALYHLREVRPEPVPALVTAKKANKAKPAAQDDEEELPEHDPLASWPYVERVKGLRVVLLGGETREERRAVLHRAFQFESLDWVPTDRPRLIASLAERAARGTLDFVLVTKFVRHKETDAIERAAHTPLLSLRHGYGVTAVRQAFEEYFSRGDERASGKARRSV